LPARTSPTWTPVTMFTTVRPARGSRESRAVFARVHCTRARLGSTGQGARVDPHGGLALREQKSFALRAHETRNSCTGRSPSPPFCVKADPSIAWLIRCPPPYAGHRTLCVYRVIASSGVAAPATFSLVRRSRRHSCAIGGRST
jgi:hypothetical protein